MTSIRVTKAAEIVDLFEELLAQHGISVPRHPQTGADMLPFRTILDGLKIGAFDASDPGQADAFRAALAVHDLAVKVLSVGTHTSFPKLLDHLRLLVNGAVHITQEPPADADAYNKLIELYWACLLLSVGVEVALDPPKRGSTGKNPDIITFDGSGAAMNGYAFKTVRSHYAESIRGHIVKGVNQIEISAAPAGIVVLHLTPRLAWASQWSDDTVFNSYGDAASAAIHTMRTILGELVRDNGQPAIDAIFAGKKATGRVLCTAFLPTIAISPETGLPTFMPLKIATLVTLASVAPMPHSLYLEVWCANEVMQRQLKPV